MTSSFSRNYSIVEPHPQTVKPYIHTSRGGAGNVVKIAKISRPTSASSADSRVSTSSTPQTTFKSGRGGAGNLHHNSERTMFSFDEELQRDMRQQQAMAPVYHVGRGGAGNMAQMNNSLSRKNSETASARSTSSAESGADVATRAIRRSLEHGWARVSERF